MKIRGVELISGVEASKLSFEDLQKLVKPIFKSARQRAERMFKSEKISTTMSPALRGAINSRPRGQVSLFESRRKSRDELLMEYARARHFLTDETSTVKGTMQYVKSVNEALKKQANIQGLDEKGTLDMLKIFDELEENDNNAWIANQRFKYELFEAISAEMVKDKDANASEIIERVQNILDDIYTSKIQEDEFYEIF